MILATVTFLILASSDEFLPESRSQRPSGEVKSKFHFNTKDLADCPCLHPHPPTSHTHIHTKTDPCRHRQTYTQCSCLNSLSTETAPCWKAAAIKTRLETSKQIGLSKQYKMLANRCRCAQQQSRILNRLASLFGPNPATFTSNYSNLLYWRRTSPSS